MIKTCGQKGTRVHYREGTSITGGVNKLLMKVEVLDTLETLGHCAVDNGGVFMVVDEML